MGLQTLPQTRPPALQRDQNLEKDFPLALWISLALVMVRSSAVALDVGAGLVLAHSVKAVRGSV